MRKKISKTFYFAEGESTDDIIPRLQFLEFSFFASSRLFSAEQITSE